MKLTENKEYKRGYRNCLKSASELGYRSFFIKNGVLYAYTKSGSRHIVSKYANKTEVFKTNWKKEDAYWAGYFAALRKLLKQKPTKRKVRTPRKTIFGV